MALPQILYPGVGATGGPVNTDDIIGWGVGASSGDIRGYAQPTVYQIIFTLRTQRSEIWSYEDETLRDANFDTMLAAAGTLIGS